MSQIDGVLFSLLDQLAEKANVLGIQEGLSRGHWFKNGELTPTGEDFFKQSEQMKMEINEIKAKIMNLLK